VLAGSRSSAEFASAGGLTLKGLSEPVTAWRVSWVRARSGALPSRLAEATARGACVGREPELARLESEWSAAEHGGRRLVLISGEPGVGKTRLAAALAAR